MNTDGDKTGEEMTGSKAENDRKKSKKKKRTGPSRVSSHLNDTKQSFIRDWLVFGGEQGVSNREHCSNDTREDPEDRSPPISVNALLLKVMKGTLRRVQ